MRELILQLPIRAALIEVDGVTVRAGDDDDGAAHAGLEAMAAQYRAQCEAAGITSPGGVDGVQTARILFRQLRIDPTKHRPSSEALLRRGLKTQPMPRVNNLVDVGNWCSLEMLLPLGLYDGARIEGSTITLRQGTADERYVAINEKELNLSERYVLADSVGAFGSPMKDSLRTAVTTAAIEAVVVLYAPLSYDETALRRWGETMGERVTECCGGAVRDVLVHAGV